VSFGSVKLKLMVRLGTHVGLPAVRTNPFSNLSGHHPAFSTFRQTEMVGGTSNALLIRVK
jgi:hypothetical protein